MQFLLILFISRIYYHNVIFKRNFEGILVPTSGPLCRAKYRGGACDIRGVRFFLKPLLADFQINKFFFLNLDPYEVTVRKEYQVASATYRPVHCALREFIEEVNTLW